MVDIKIIKNGGSADSTGRACKHQNTFCSRRYANVYVYMCFYLILHIHVRTSERLSMCFFFMIKRAPEWICILFVPTRVLACMFR